MASHFLNNRHKQIKTLEKDIDYIEKKLTKVLGEKEGGKSSSTGNERKISNVTKPCRSIPSNVKKNSGKDQIPKRDRKSKSATLEVTVKTKRHGKPSKSNGKPESVKKMDSNIRDKTSEDIPSEEKRQCCCVLDSKNIIWSNILKHSELTKSAVRNSKEETIIHNEVCDDQTKGNPCTADCHRIRHPLNSHECTSQHLVNDFGKGVVCNHLIRTDFSTSGKYIEEDMKTKNIPQLPDDKRLKLQQTYSGVGQYCPANGSTFQPIENLCMLMEELCRTTANQPTRTLVQDMETALKKLCKVAENSSVSSESNKLPSNRALSGKLTNGAAEGVTEETDGGRMKNNAKAHLVADAMVQVPSLSHRDDKDPISGERTKEDILMCQDGPEPNNQKKYAVAEKFELLVKVNDDDGARRQYILGNDEKLKTEIEYLNKQLNLQLKSVEGLSTKESKYHKLISSLIEKVDKLEAQVNEQTKVTQHFHTRCNCLMEQNSAIPKMQKKIDDLNKQLKNNTCNYEKLKIEFCMMKLEREKYHALNCEKEKDISRLKEKIKKTQTLVSQQMQNVNRYVGYSSAAKKVDDLLCTIDTESNLIKAKINDSIDVAEVEISGMESPSLVSPDSQSKPMSPFSFSVRLSSPDKIHKPTGEVISNG